MKTILCFGEIMARLSPPRHLRLRQAMPGSLDVTFAGAEANAAAAIAALGGSSRFATALPDNAITDACCAFLRSAAIDESCVLRSGAGRFGLYYVEHGADRRGGSVLYDREGSSFACTPWSAYPWPAMSAGAAWFHTTGVSPGVSRVASETTLAAARAARAGGLTVSCDLNYRGKLWRWEPGTEPAALFRRTLAPLVAVSDVLLGGMADLALLLDRPLREDHLAEPSEARALAEAVAGLHPNVRLVAATLRVGLSASRQRWGAVLLDTRSGRFCSSPLVSGAYVAYEIGAVVDRLGAGDAFAGAFIHALLTEELSAPQRALDFATAASCLAHTVQGDFLCASRAEVEAVMAGAAGGRLSR